MYEAHDLIQGSPEWHQFRFNHHGASEAAAMLGLSKKTTRTALLHMKHTGMQKEFSDWVQANILDKGHEVEALARPLVAAIIGRELYPVTCSMGKLSASCDGLTMDDSVAFEHKQFNQTLFSNVLRGNLPDEHMPQCQQVLMVTGAEKIIFVVSNGTVEHLAHMEVMPDPVWFERINAGWDQFERDLAAYIPAEIKEMPKAVVSIDLPTLFVHARGEITEHNMEAFGLALTGRLAEVRSIELVTDQDFSNAKDAAKQFRDTAKAIALSKEAMLAQTETIGEAARKMDAWAKDLNATALQLEKDVEREDLAKKAEMVGAANNALTAHIAQLEAETVPIKLNLLSPRFADAIKGKRNYTAMQDAINTALANATIAADFCAKDIRSKLAWCKENAAGMDALFPDLPQIITKQMDDFTLLISTRIDTHKAEQDKRIEEERQRIQKEEEAKAAAKVVEAAKVADPVAKVEEVSAPAAPTLVPPPAPVDSRAAVVEQGDDIREFLNSLDVSEKKRQEIRPFIVAFVKYRANRGLNALVPNLNR